MLLTKLCTLFESDIIQHRATSHIVISHQDGIHNQLVDARRKANKEPLPAIARLYQWEKQKQF